MLVLLLHGRFFRYWPVLIYVSWELLATAGFTIADIRFHGTAATGNHFTLAQAWYARLYWVNDVVVDLFRFVLVIILIYMASEGWKRVSGRLLAGVVAVTLALPFVLFDVRWKLVDVGQVPVWFPNTIWFRSTSELLNFGAAIMNLILWTVLLRWKKRDPQVLLLSLGLGIVVTGTAIAYGISFLFRQNQVSSTGYLFMNLTQLAGWAIWIRAFQARKPEWKPAGARPIPVISPEVRERL